MDGGELREKKSLEGVDDGWMEIYLHNVLERTIPVLVLLLCILFFDGNSNM
jgi:hypothetical protein